MRAANAQTEGHLPTMRFLSLLIAFYTLAAPALADSLAGRVVTIADGQQHAAQDQIMGIDAPESGQPYGSVSGDNLGKLVFGKQVSIEYDKLDRYGRIVGKVLISSDDANLKQVEAGLAWHYKEYQHEQSPLDRQLYSLTETQARRDHIGLWLDPEPVPPWEWRKRGSTGSCARSCADLGSCDAAMRQLRECSGTGIDGDGDGVPCETLCR